MKSTTKILLLLAGMYMSYSALITVQAQTFKNRELEQQHVARIKQFNEFVDRFNYKVKFDGEEIDPLFRETYPRKRYLRHLFDTAYFSQPWKIDLKNEFINDIVSNNFILYKYSNKIIAEARTRIFYYGNLEYVTIYLGQEKVGGDMVKWVVLDVSGDVLDFMEDDSTHTRFISPSSNETNFINLKRAMQDSTHLQSYASSSYLYNPLSVFFYCINQGIIKIEHVEKLSYHINDIQGWCIKIEEFNRPGYNSGWLISDLNVCK